MKFLRLHGKIIPGKGIKHFITVCNKADLLLMRMKILIKGLLKTKHQISLACELSRFTYSSAQS